MDFKKKLKNFFIPSLQNQLRPYSLRYGTLLFVVLLAIAIELAFLAYVNVAFKENELLGSVISSLKTGVAEALPAVIFEDTNTQREENNETDLAYSDLLAKAAKLKAQDMVAQKYFSHESPDGLMAWDWMTEVGYDYSYAGENLAVNFFDAQDVVDAWMNSPTHRENILNDNFTEVGIAAVRGRYEGRDTIFVVQLFGTPAPEPIYQNYAWQSTTTTPQVLAANKVAVVSTTKPAVAVADKTSAAKTSTSSLATTTGIAAAEIAASSTVATATTQAHLSKLTTAQRWMVSPRRIARNAFIVLIIYMLLSLLIPMYMIYHRHASADRWLRFREIFILFKQPIISALVTLTCVLAALGLNYYWSKIGTDIFPASFPSMSTFDFMSKK